jgi:CheY-like chemotaxis protein
MHTRRPIPVVHLDDDEEVLAAAKRASEAARPGIRVETTTDPEVALGLIPVADCVVTEYAVAGTDGLAFLEAVRALDPDLPVVFFTGRESAEVAAAFDHGATDYLRKSADAGQYTLLANRIVNLVAGYRAGRTAREATAQVARLCDRLGEGYVSVGSDWTVRYLDSVAAALLCDESPEPGGSFWALLGDLEGRDRSALETAMADRRPTALDRYVEVRAYPSGEGLSVYCRDVTRERDLDFDPAVPGESGVTAYLGDVQRPSRGL